MVVLPLSRTAHLQRFMVIGPIPTELYQYFSSIQNLVIFDPSTFFYWFLFNNFDHCCSWGNFSSRPLRKKLETNIINRFLLISVMCLGGRREFRAKKTHFQF